MTSSEIVPTLTHRQIAKSIKGKTGRPVKNVLCTPFKVVWPSVDGQTQKAILDELKRSFNDRNLRNPLAQNPQYKRLKKDERLHEKEKFLTESKQSLEDINLRQQLVFGVTEITRALERNRLRLVVVDRSSPWQLHRHLAQLSAVRDCSAVALDGVSEALSPLVSVTKMCALGFKMKQDKDSDFFDQTVISICAKCPHIEVPWLDCENALMTIKREASDLVKSSDAGNADGCVFDEEEPVPEQKDYSHLYVKKSSLLSEVEVKLESKASSEIWSFDDLTVIDDMWGLTKKKKLQRELQNDNEQKSVLNESMKDVSSATVMPKKMKTNKKRAYHELNVKEVVKNPKKKK